MPATDASVMTPSRQLIEGPSAWIGADMRGREAEWSYRLSPSEIAEIEAALKSVQARGLDVADIRREDFPLPTLGPVLDRLRGLRLRRARLRAATRRAGRRPADRRECRSVLGHRHLFRQRPLAECEGASARACLRPGRKQRDESQYSQLCNRGRAELPYRSLRRRGAPVPAAREVGRTVGDRQFDDRAQRHGGAPAGSAGTGCIGRSPSIAAARCRKARRRSTRRRCSTNTQASSRCCIPGCISVRRSAFRKHGRPTAEDIEALDMFGDLRGDP